MLDAGLLNTSEYKRAGVLEGRSAYARGHARDNWLTGTLRMRRMLRGVIALHTHTVISDQC